MKHRSAILAALIVAALSAPLAAQEAEPDGSVGEGFNLLGEGSRMILEGMLDQMRPMLEEARPFFEEELVPFVERMGELIDDLSSYELPERLPNGDILIRRSPDAPPMEPLPEPAPESEIEL